MVYVGGDKGRWFPNGETVAKKAKHKIVISGWTAKWTKFCL